MRDLYDINRISTENELQYLWRIGQAKDNGLIDLSWDAIGDIMNAEFREDETEYRHSSAYRKCYQYGSKLVEAGVFNTLPQSNIAEKLELEKEIIKIRDERNELKRLIRSEARKESFKDQLVRAVTEHVSDPLKYNDEMNFKGVIKSDNDVIITFFDVHTGLNVNNYFNTFNSTILKKRINQYLDKIFEVQLRHGSENAYVLLSELINGIIHTELRLENNQTSIEQFLTIMDYLSEFISELSYKFNNVYVYCCMGNHSRQQAKREDNQRLENFDLLAIPFLQAKLQNFKNVHCKNNEIEPATALFYVRNHSICAVHGDRDSMDSVSGRMMEFIGNRPDIVFMGHLHTNALKTDFDTKVIRAGSFTGGGDSYSLDKRLKNKPEQVIAVINDNGLDCLYDVKFK